MVDKWINVIVNTVIVMPFMVQKEPLKVLKDIQKEFSFTPEKVQEKRNSLKRRRSLVQMSSVIDEKGNKFDVVESCGPLVMPNMNFFVAPLLYDDFR